MMILAHHLITITCIASTRATAEIVPDTGLKIQLSEWTLEAWDDYYNRGSTACTRTHTHCQPNKSAVQVFSNLQAHVPGDVITTLIENGIVSDPYYGINFVRDRHIWMGQHTLSVKDAAEYCGVANLDNGDVDNPNLELRTRTWIYRKTVDLASVLDLSYVNSIRRLRANSANIPRVSLVLEGVKMGGHVYIHDDSFLGTVTDQFLRYSFDVPSEVLLMLLDEERAVVEIRVEFDPCIDTMGRFMACSGGWDWAPYSRGGDLRGSSVLSFGIVKEAYLITVQQVAITHVVPHVQYLGEYPMSPLLSGPEADFRVDVDVYLYSITDVNHLAGEIILKSDFAESIHQQIKTLARGHNKITLSVIASKGSIDLWWPLNMGSQPLYKIQVSFRDSMHETRWVQKQIGFRTSALVTSNEFQNNGMSNNKDKEGSGTHGMYFRINGAVVWCRGANVVPIDQLEGRMADEAHRSMVQSAASAGMNMLRVWGGGMILAASFYDACDEMGLLLFHDMMYVQEQNHPPRRTMVQEEELRFNIRELASHPSIVIWNGCNECSVEMGTQSEIYATFVLRVVGEEDNTRSIWPSSPSVSGWKTGVQSIDGKPNGNLLTTATATSSKNHTLESHGPYWHGSSDTNPAVNGPLDGSGKFKANIPVAFHYSNPESLLRGPAFQNQFISEFGASVFSSFESMSTLLDKSIWGVHGGAPSDECDQYYENMNLCNGTNVMAERNYPCDHIMREFFGESGFDDVGEVAFQRQLYQCMLSQALVIKSEIESQRSKNTYGSLIWQLNENWPTGGWGCIEHDPRRWKPLMYFLHKYLFRDVIIACGEGGKCYVKNNGISGIEGVVSIVGYDVSANVETENLIMPITMPTGEGSIEWFDITVPNEGDVLILKFISGDDILAENFAIYSTPKSWSIKNDTGLHYSIAAGGSIHLVADTIALWVTLSTRAIGRFSDNAFIILPGEEKVVKFIPASYNGLTQSIFIQLKESLRVEHAAMYL